MGFVQSGATGFVKGLVTCFWKFPIACLGSMAAAVQPNSLWNSQKTFYKTAFTTCRPRLYNHANFCSVTKPSSALPKLREERTNEVRFMGHETCCATQLAWVGGHFSSLFCRSRERICSRNWGRGRAARFVVASLPTQSRVLISHYKTQ